MTLRAGELALVCGEVERALVGLPVHKVVQPDEETVLVQLRGRWLLLCVSARAGRLHLVDEKPAGTGEAAPAFCMLLRKHLVGARLASVHAVEGERACELELGSAEGSLLLRLFLFGPAAQLQLVEDGRVLGAIGPARRPYEGLPAPHPASSAQQAIRVDPTRSDTDAPISRQIASLYDERAHVASVEEARRAARQAIAGERRKLERLQRKLDEDLGRADQAQLRRKEADLLLAHLHEVPRGAASVTLPDDFTDGSPLEIMLDPARSARDNAERLYKEQRRLAKARGQIAARRAEVAGRLSELAERLATLEQSSDEAVLAGARARPPAATKERAAAERALPYKRYLSTTGVPIYVGRGAARNDELTFKIARGNDLWLHTRDVPGAHVVVPLEGGRNVDEATLVDAATLAAHHSNARGEAQVDVGYALRKHVRKPRGAPPGSVLVSHEKTIRVRIEPDRLRRLLDPSR